MAMVAILFAISSSPLLSVLQSLSGLPGSAPGQLSFVSIQLAFQQVFFRLAAAICDT